MTHSCSDAASYCVEQSTELFLICGMRTLMAAPSLEGGTGGMQSALSTTAEGAPHICDLRMQLALISSQV